MLKIQEVGKSGGMFNVKPGTSSPINIAAADIRKPAEKKGTWSKTITLSATKNNGARLGFYFEINLETSTFDVNKKLPVLLLENDVEIEGHFFMQLVKINKKNNRVTSYEVVVKDDVSDFFTIINTRYLSDLDYTDSDHFLTAANVAATFANTAATSQYMYHLTMNDNDVYDITQFKPGFWLRSLWDRIHARAGKAYEWTTMNDADTKFDNLFIPSNVDKATSDTNPLVVATQGSWTKTATGVGEPAPITLEPFIVGTEVLDVSNLYNPGTGAYTSPIVVGAGSSMIYNLKFRAQLTIKNNTANTIKLFGSSAAIGMAARVYVKKNGTAITQNLIPVTGFVYPNGGTTIPGNGSFTVFNSQVDFNINVSGLAIGDVLTLFQTVQQFYTGHYWGDNVTTNPVSVSNILTITGIEMNILPNGGNGYGYGEYIQLNKFIPQKVKQSEIVAAVMTLNNLIVDREKSTPNKIVYTKRDKYLDDGVVKDWDKSRKLDKGQEHEITFLPDLTAKTHRLSYKEDTDAANVGYLENTQEVYGQVEYTFKSEFSKDIETTEIVFSPTPMASTTFGAVVPLFSGKTPGCNIRLLYAGGVKTCGNFRITNFPGNSLLITTGYPYVGHFDDPIAPKFDINFGLCDFYFYSSILAFTNRNMFNLNWRRTFNQIDNGRMLTGMFKLDEYDIKTLRLNDKIFVENEYWNINKVIDYDPNNRGLTKVELISVDDMLKIPIRTKTPVVIGTGSVIANPIKKVIDKVNAGLNSAPGLGQVTILGKGNIIDQGVKNALVVGDDQLIEKDGVYTPMLKVTGDEPAEFCESGIKVSAIYDCGSGVLMVGNFDFNNTPTVNGVPILSGSVAWGTITGTLSAQTDLQTALNGKQPLSAILTALAALAGATGILVKTGASSFVTRAITQPAAGITLTSADGVSGNPTIALANDLAALEGLGGTGIAVRSAVDTWVQRVLAAPAAGFTITNPGGVAGNITFVLSNDLAGLEGLGSTGFAVRSATDTWVQRLIAGTAGQIVVTNGNGVSGNPTLSLDPAIVTGAGLWVRGSTGAGALTGTTQAGNGNDSTGGASCAIGSVTLASGTNSFANGSGTTASGFASEAGGVNAEASRIGEWARSSETAIGQYGVVSMSVQTTNAVSTEMFIQGTQRFVLATAENYHFKITIIGKRINAGGSGIGSGLSWTMETLLKNVGGTVSQVGSTAAVMLSDLGGAPVLTVTADNVNKSLRVQVTGVLGATINWMAKIEYTKVV